MMCHQGTLNKLNLKKLIEHCEICSYVGSIA